MQQDHIKNAVGPVVVSALSRLQGDPDRFRRVYLRAIGAVALACMPIVALLFVFADEVIAILLGPGWGEAATVFRVLAPAAMLGAINIAPGWLCVARGRVKIQVVWAAISAPVVVGGFVVGVAWGVVGVAAAFSVTWCIMLLLFIAMACRGSPVSFWQVIATAWPAMVASVAATAVCVAAGGHVLQADAPIAVGIAVKGLLFASTFAAVLLCHSSARRCAAELWRSRGIAMAIREAEEVA